MSFLIGNDEVVYKTMEENNWKRHEEQMNVNGNIQTVLEKILDEQKSTSKIMIVLTIFTIIVGLIAAHDQLANLCSFLLNLKI